MPIERTGANPGALRDLIHAGFRSSAREDLPGYFQNSLAIAFRIGAGFTGNSLNGRFFHGTFLKPETLSGNLLRNGA
jgi:hypothetical protein